MLILKFRQIFQQWKSLRIIQYYNEHVQVSPTLDATLATAYSNAADSGLVGLALTTQDKADIVEFLKTLTDTTFINNPAHSNPF